MSTNGWIECFGNLAVSKPFWKDIAIKNLDDNIALKTKNKMLSEENKKLSEENKKLHDEIRLIKKT